MHKYAFVFLTLLAAKSYACEPCKKPSPEQAFQEADLVVVAKQIGSPQRSQDCGTKPESGPHSTKIQIVRTLKGNASLSELSIRSCYGMCDYGLFLEDNSEYLVFLKQTNKQFETLGCKADELLIKEGKIEISGKKIALETWLKNLNKDRPKK